MCNNQNAPSVAILNKYGTLSLISIYHFFSYFIKLVFILPRVQAKAKSDSELRKLSCDFWKALELGITSLFVCFWNGYGDHFSLQLRLLIEYDWFI